VPHVGTIQMWARNPPIPLNFALGNPNNATCFEHLAQGTLRKALANGIWPKEDFNGGGTVVSYLNGKGDNDEPYGNSISGVRAIQHVRICPHSHESHVRTDPIDAAPSVVLHPNRGSP
jgi:hypothetical protein